MKKYDLIIFDWDGTIVDSIEWIVSSLRNAARECGFEMPDKRAVRDIIGLSLVKALDCLFPELDGDQREKLTKCYSQHFLSRQISRDDLFSGVYDMLTELNENGYRLAVATGKTRAGLQRAMLQTETDDLFLTTRCADETASKPDPLMLNEIIAQLDVEKGRVLMIGDSIHDLQMAGNAGIASVAVSCGAHSSIILEKYNPLACLPQTTDLMSFVRG